ncbi:MAG: phenylalanine--tRNA ligase subunit alpha [Clostridia bacterium]|nr:phenylalanine--tRNA ligase subunit alpha [Clostridia bacterium]MCI1959595.1 phenylalanine--tRNA ligase subunit alpha [Clostridia bacterium]MCI2000319.1 phenylalanine--tRNA ligase subunit alpha [Clostridia bacterium]MCI2015499.1 phenylalanine--tRNA ligase subunit alpha [Clostridia bacterium]
MKKKLQEIYEKAIATLEGVEQTKDLDDVKVKYLGKKGELTNILKSMKDLSSDERPVIGQIANQVRSGIEQKIDEVKDKLAAAELNAILDKETLDVTMPGRACACGHRHPLDTVIDEISNIFIGMGYEIADGPEIEKDYYNFEALNIPANHPAKDEQDTFYINGDILLRTQTSPVQIRTMEKGKLPVRMICPGSVYRADEVDATHSPIFHQLEGLVVDKNITMGDLKGALATFAKELFGKDTKVRFRPHHFPFTEPSAEMDVTCFACGGKGCRVCKGEGYIEVLGCGMVHPNVLKRCGIDPEEYSGFAFGMGLERVAMQRYGITDLRLLYENDVKFLKQF